MGKHPRHDHFAEATRWMADNPQAMALFSRFALQMACRRHRFGIGLIAERVRWETLIAKDGDFKVNNNYRAYIARRLLNEHPELEGKLTFRMVRSGPDAFRPVEELQ